MTTTIKSPVGSSPRPAPAAPGGDTSREAGSALSLGLLAQLFLLGAVWGAAFLFLRVASPEVGPVWAAEIRIAIGAGLLALIAGRRTWAIARRDLRAFAIAGAAFSAVPFTLIAIATLTLPTGLAAVLNAATPIFTALLGVVWLGQRLSIRLATGLLVGVAAVVLLVGWSPLPAGPATLVAIAAALGAAISYAFAGTFVRRRFPTIGGVELATAQLAAGALVLLPVADLVRCSRARHPSARSLRSSASDAVDGPALADLPPDPVEDDADDREHRDLRRSGVRDRLGIDRPRRADRARARRGLRARDRQPRARHRNPGRRATTARPAPAVAGAARRSERGLIPRQPAEISGFGWTTASTLSLGSRNQAAHEWPMSATPSSVTGSGASYSSIRTPSARSSATAARMSGTRHASCVWVSAGPDRAEGHRDLRAAARAEDDPVARVLAEDLEPEHVPVERPGRVEILRQQDREHRMVVQHAHACLLTDRVGSPSAHDRAVAESGADNEIPAAEGGGRDQDGADRGRR